MNYNLAWPPQTFSQRALSVLLAVAAVHDGYVLSRSVISSPVGGELMAECLGQSLRDKGTELHPRHAFQRVESSPGQFETKYEARSYRGPDGELHTPKATASYNAMAVQSIVLDIKDAICRVSDTPFDPEENASIPTAAYELPDGQEIQIGPDRFTIPELLFDPELLSRYGRPGKAALASAPPGEGGEPGSLLSLQDTVNASISRCDVDVRREFYGGVVLVGGTSLLQGLRERLEKQLTAIAPQVARVKVGREGEGGGVLDEGECDEHGMCVNLSFIDTTRREL
ncbi:actin [Helicosporidium sp. ATCC 50920]|nr:actin [Helicosporidium sp. ATCC 50920]|eukprot:KDD76646.1 actin [Helicosporidium sp. ATCC 50920]